ncbi:MAG: 50S ribosomal protein L31 [Candidatus Magasanikbacteria bacterium GW2011_GWA2_45_39]|uniref:Large ribosomal subunit protein bL31 n=2 Tax=Candidatus Magasanikiibacteriota TaxID=1752731 RepID=A0A0G1MYJ7_9BACT|nr:MAG: 50S ribosomal protein L31 [Candidatus Magasanikbacteria bacterium GW2011_GWA2_45_39]KKU13314.1 MAG: 50S ribosomal protein L31 [Candidatus Magasanikbacteria bacterium GW2011_GWC2_45_8]HBW74381.1 50S ribosomal protein L31 [Candidatus Magasanikbacteria bacterium]
MKKDTHPKYYPKAQITCACGKTWITGSTREEIKVELCSNCHPFYTGKQKFLDAARRVEKFQEKSAKKIVASAARKGKKAKKAARVAKKTTTTTDAD